jgi:hypothetical protein
LIDRTDILEQAQRWVRARSVAAQMTYPDGTSRLKPVNTGCKVEIHQSRTLLRISNTNLFFHPTHLDQMNALRFFFGERRIGIWRDADVAMPILPLLFMFEASPF